MVRCALLVVVYYHRGRLQVGVYRALDGGADPDPAHTQPDFWSVKLKTPSTPIGLQVSASWPRIDPAVLGRWGQLVHGLSGLERDWRS